MIIAINKPKGPSSFYIVKRIRKITGIKRVGHGGTLDPLASGVLVVAIGREFTKKLPEVVKSDKEYIADVRLGVYSSTDDEEGEKQVVDVLKKPAKKEIKLILKKFTGEIMQKPPIYSAIKIAGQPAYKSARKGQNLELKSRPVEIKKIKLLKYKYPDLKIKINCGKGTYIRSLARDLGEQLGTGAYLSDLLRTRVGDFSLKKSLTLEKFQKNFDN